MITALRGRKPELPLNLTLPSGEQLQIQQWLRVLPEQRYVGRAEWQGRQVLAKLYVGSKAQRHHSREEQGVRMLAQQQIPTPQLLDSGQHESLCWVLFEFLSDAQPLQQQINDLQHALTCIAAMHRQGLWQADLHLDNFLQHQQQLYVIDGGGVQWQAAGQPLSADKVLQNLAVFFAQLDSWCDEQLKQLLHHYQQYSSIKLELGQLQKEISKVRSWRIRDYLKKTARDCTLFSFSKDKAGICAAQRDWLETVQPMLSEPDAFIEQGHIYKTGGAATVARVKHAEQSFIIKRYNIKNWQHWLKRCWRPSRAWHSWQAGFLLQLSGIAVVENLAVREQRRYGLRHTAWLISSYAGEQDLVARFAPYIDNAQVPLADLQQLQQLLQAMIREKISHGDLKGHNILWHNDRCLLIDLDAVKQHRCPRSFARAFARDRARLLRNWPQDSQLYRLLDEKLPQVSKPATAQEAH